VTVAAESGEAASFTESGHGATSIAPENAPQGRDRTPLCAVIRDMTQLRWSDRGTFRAGSTAMMTRFVLGVAARSDANVNVSS
jgi:hypothetical protein